MRVCLLLALCLPGVAAMGGPMAMGMGGAMGGQGGMGAVMGQSRESIAALSVNNKRGPSLQGQEASMQ